MYEKSDSCSIGDYNQANNEKHESKCTVIMYTVKLDTLR